MSVTDSIQDIKFKLGRASSSIKPSGDKSCITNYVVLFILLLERDEVISFDLRDSKNFFKEIRNAILKIKDDRSAFYESLFNEFEEILSEEALAFSMIIEYIKTNHETITKSFVEIFDDLLIKLLKGKCAIDIDFISRPDFSQFICQLTDLPPDATIYNPFAGLHSLTLCFDQRIKIDSQELSHEVYTVGILRILAYNKFENNLVSLENSIVNWNSQKGKYDLIIASPPFGMRLSKDAPPALKKFKTIEHFLIENSIKDLSTGGKLVLIIANAFLSRPGAERKLREYIVELDILEAIISIPGGILVNTAVPITLLVIDKSKSRKGSVKFIDAKPFLKNISAREKTLDYDALLEIIKNDFSTVSARVVSNSVVAELEYNLNVHRFLTPELILDPAVRLVKIADLTSVLRGLGPNDVTSGKLVKIKDLKEKVLDFHLDIANIPDRELSKSNTQLAESCLLLAIKWSSLKPTYFTFENDPIFVGNDIVGLKVDEGLVDLGYLINELSSPYVTQQVESFRSGALLPSIRKEELLSIKIQLPSLSEQKAKVKGFVEAIAKEKEKDLVTFNTIHGLENELIQQNAYLRHTLAGASSNLKGSLTALKKIIDEQIITMIPEVMDFKVSPAHSLNFSKYLAIIERDINKIAQTTSKVITSLNPLEKKELYPVEIFDFLQNYILEKKSIGNLSYQIEFQFDEKTFMDENGQIITTYISANTELLTNLLDNLFLNAEQHAFPGHTNNRIEIHLMVEDEDTIPNINLLVSNTGGVLPDDFTINDYTRKGSTAGENAGEGYGGWLVYQIVKFFDGQIDFIDEQGPEGLPGTDLATSFEIIIPITQIDVNEAI